VTDTGNKQVMVFDSTGAFVARFGMEDGGNPVDVFVAGDRIYVSHLSGTKVRVYDRATREPVFGFPNVPPADSTGLAAPANLFVTGDRVYVSDLLKQQVLVYSTEGRWLQTIGRPGLGPSTFNRPKGVAVDRDGLVYVVDAGFDNIQVFRPDGRLLMFFGGPGEQRGSMVLPAKVVLDYEHLDYFAKYVAPGYALKYLIFVTNQYGPWKINVYGVIQPAGASSPTRNGR
jgi:DNA-binding beta-propeller fold protein YncE